MAQQNSRMKISSVGTVTVVELVDKKILDEMNIRQIGDQLNSLAESANAPKILMDLSNVAHMSSSALSILIKLYKRVRERKGQLRLCCVQPAIHEIFQITRLNEIFHLDPSREQALEAMQA